MSGPGIHGRTHVAGGTDPIPGIGGGGGGGIMFDTYPQDGGWLYVETDDEAGSPSGFGIELSDFSAGGAFLGALAGGDLQLKASGGGSVDLRSTGALDITGTNSTSGIHLAATNGPLLAEAADGIQILGAATGEPVILASVTNSPGGGMYARLEDNVFTLHSSDGTGDPTGIGSPWLLIDGTGYYMRTGATWVASL